jgi:SAM-dependent methyltransferase
MNMDSNMNSDEANGQQGGPVEPHSNDQTYYDQTSHKEASEEAHELWMREIEHYYNGYAQRLDLALAGTTGNVAELGAGSCGLSVCLSRLPNVQRVSALDISMKRMEKMIDLSAKILGGDRKKIRPMACDFNYRLPFADGELDAVVFDAALHHARNLWGLLSECNRVLKDRGILIAQREAYLSPLRYKNQLNKLLSTPEIAAKVSENIYLKEQYSYYIKIHGFDVEFIPRTRGLFKRLLSPLSGILFTDGILYCRKVIKAN